MKSDRDKKQSSMIPGLLGGIVGIGLGILGAVVFNEVSKEKEEARKQDEIQISNQVTSDWDDYESFLCPISQEVMYDPVITPRGISFERKAILKWLEKKKECPITKTPLSEKELITNYALKQAIDRYFAIQKNKSN
jgi:hypothetical protein